MKSFSNKNVYLGFIPTPSGKNSRKTQKEDKEFYQGLFIMGEVIKKSVGKEESLERERSVEKENFPENHSLEKDIAL